MNCLIRVCSSISIPSQSEKFNEVEQVIKARDVQWSGREPNQAVEAWNKLSGRKTVELVEINIWPKDFQMLYKLILSFVPCCFQQVNNSRYVIYSEGVNVCCYMLAKGIVLNEYLWHDYFVRWARMTKNSRDLTKVLHISFVTFMLLSISFVLRN